MHVKFSSIISTAAASLGEQTPKNFNTTTLPTFMLSETSDFRLQQTSIRPFPVFRSQIPSIPGLSDLGSITFDSSDLLVYHSLLEVTSIMVP